ncbi:E3 SUMO-protein ligase ZBED1-like [Argopecten irradians]|uniref:E3 SUMO-protein ligase ZBED1-like n=1 Tax=Argopecten irradians TaxID=31199 RepID=UPI0037199569
MIQETVTKCLQKADFVALTTYAWTSRATQNYNTITVHFLDNWELKSFMLQTRVMYESHTAEHLSELLINAVNEWNLKRHDQMPSLTTDNAKNIINAEQLAGFQPHIGCITHTINLATQRGLKVPQLDRLLGRIRRVVTYFHKSNIAMAILNTKQTLLELPHLKLIMDVSTRWNSTFNMLECFLEQQPAIEATLLNKDLKKNFKDVYTMSGDDISTAKYRSLLSLQKSPTVSLIHPLKEMLLQQLRVIQNDDGNVVTAAKEAMIKDLEQRYSDHTMKLFLHESFCIDPRFKGMPYLDDAAKEEVYKSLAQKTEHVVKTIQMISKIKTEKMGDDEQPNLDPTPPLPSMSVSSTSALTCTKASDANPDDSATPCKNQNQHCTICLERFL